MALVIFDTETADYSGGVVELASIILTDSGKRYQFLERCNPRRPISQGAKDVHGISDEDVENCRTDLEVAQEWVSDLESLGEEVVLCAHNLVFDNKIMSQLVDLRGYKKFCSLKLARSLFPDLGSHKLEFLYESMNFTEKFNAHSALDDCLMLEKILMKMLGNTNYRQIPALQAPHVLTYISFGKHKGKKYTELPKDYLKWLVENSDNPNVVHTAQVCLS